MLVPVAAVSLRNGTGFGTPLESLYALHGVCSGHNIEANPQGMTPTEHGHVCRCMKSSGVYVDTHPA